MAVDTDEETFEGEIVADLTADYEEEEWGEGQTTLYSDFQPGGYHRRENKDFDTEYCLIREDALTFVRSVYPQQWQKLEDLHGEDATEEFLDTLNREISRRGTLDVLRRGISLSGARDMCMAAFKPASTRNPKAMEDYRENVFSVIRGLRYRDGEALAPDLTIFLNGLPIFTAELKNPLTGQDVTDAKRQYKEDRDPRDTLFSYGRCLAHFAVDPHEVYMTTELKGEDTEFLPFNKGHEKGAGNPPNPSGYQTEYFWKYLLSKDSVLDLVQNFITEFRRRDEDGNLTQDELLIFPRYHQLSAVREMVSDARHNGSGERYLIQHSAGSGKTFTISWLAHQLADLHDENDDPVFDSVIVISDRRVLDDQLQHHLKQFEQAQGVVRNIKGRSVELKEALEAGEKIIVSTIHKFSYIVDEMEAMESDTFAVLIDEAHSSQTGELKDSQTKTLAPGGDEETDEDEEEPDMQEQVTRDIQQRGPLPNVSSFAFTATPKPKTLEMFGDEQNDGTYEPFSLYSMRQAIEEGFIEDVLQNYTTYDEYFSLLKTVEDNPEYETAKAKRLLKAFVREHNHVIAQKAQIMVEHFQERVRDRVGGRAKAMLVTGSRVQVLKYKRAFDEYIEDQEYDVGVLAAFSPFTHDGEKYTEQRVNQGLDQPVEDQFQDDHYRILIVANKFQTGFDQPLLHTMYVDKKLSGVRAVQTLSRLNRTHPDKDETMVVDFKNDAETIQKAFKPFYEKTTLEKSTDPRLLYDLERQLKDFHIYTEGEIETFCELWYDSDTELKEIYAALQPPLDRYESAPEEEQESFRSKLNDFIRLYAFLIKVIEFEDEELHKLYQFGRALYRELPVERGDMPNEVKQYVDLDRYRIEEIQSEEDRSLSEGDEGLESQHKSKDGSPRTDEQRDPLDVIVERLNKQFGYDLDEEDRVFIKHLRDRLNRNAALRDMVEKNSPKKARMKFEEVTENEMLDMIDQNVEFFDRASGEDQFAEEFQKWLFNQFVRSPKQTTEELIEQGENKTVEFKETLLYDVHQDQPNKELKKEAVKEICALTNTSGGHLLIGVDDNGTVQGLDRDFKIIQKEKDGFSLQLHQAISDALGDTFAAQRVETTFEDVEGETVCQVSVEPSDEPIYFEGDEFYIRDHSSSKPLNMKDTQEYIRKHFETQDDG